MTPIQRRRAKQLRALVAKGALVSCSRLMEEADDGRYLAASIKRHGDFYLVYIEAYYATPPHGQEIAQDSWFFDDLDEALRRLVEASGIPLHAFNHRP
ncbi:MAG: hypothetical protein H6741_00100 [Alphaproteobacteria bacterium]|nr:hypothetical protein [Alphaproteobacteria bacterium]MCB9791105.1 hypothetical protein [Alphaproteobacteria bacterium]